jgi:hypothetical protein
MSNITINIFDLRTVYKFHLLCLNEVQPPTVWNQPFTLPSSSPIRRGSCYIIYIILYNFLMNNDPFKLLHSLYTSISISIPYILFDKTLVHVRSQTIACISMQRKEFEGICFGSFFSFL